MENGDSDTAKYPHRTGHNARSDFMHGVKRTTSPQPLPYKGGAVLNGEVDLGEETEITVSVWYCGIIQ